MWGDAGQGVDKRSGKPMDVEWHRPGQRRKLDWHPEAVSEKRKASVRAKRIRSCTSSTSAQGPLQVAVQDKRLMTLLGFANLMRAEQYLAAPCITKSGLRAATMSGLCCAITLTTVP